MIPENLQIGKFYNYLEDQLNPSSEDLIRMIQPNCISFQKSKEDEYDVIRFLMKKNIWGPVEHITIMSDDDFPVSIGIHSKKMNEYNDLVKALQSSSFEQLMTSGQYTYFAEPFSTYLIGVAKNVQQNGDTLQTIMLKTMLL